MIAFQSTSAAKLWMDLCNLKIKRGEYVILTDKNDCAQENEELRILEHHGFIVTSDMPNYIPIRILCHGKTQEGEDFFCVKQGKHDD